MLTGKGNKQARLAFPKKYRMSEEKTLALFTGVGFAFGELVAVIRWGNFVSLGFVLGGIIGFLVGFVFLFIRNLRGINWPEP